MENQPVFWDGKPTCILGWKTNLYSAPSKRLSLTDPIHISEYLIQRLISESQGYEKHAFTFFL